MVNGKMVAISAPATAASIAPMPKLRASIQAAGIPISSAAARSDATARMAAPVLDRERKRASPAAAAVAAAAAASRAPGRTSGPNRSDGRTKSTFRGVVVKTAVPAPMRTMLTAKVERSVARGGAPTSRCTATQ
jgi:hypothetical protein